jgi:hypothetical protein
LNFARNEFAYVVLTELVSNCISLQKLYLRKGHLEPR